MRGFVPDINLIASRIHQQRTVRMVKVVVFTLFVIAVLVVAARFTFWQPGMPIKSREFARFTVILIGSIALVLAMSSSTWKDLSKDKASWQRIWYTLVAAFIFTVNAFGLLD